MRAAALVLLLAMPAFADPPPLPSIGHRGGHSTPFVIGPSRLYSRPAPTANVEVLRRRAASTRGAERVAAIDELTALLENQEPPDEQFEQLHAEIGAWYVILLREPALDKSSRADELLVRAAKNIRRLGDDEPLARQALERVIAKFPHSQYVADARMELAELFERMRAYTEAAILLREVIASRDKMFLTYARLRLGWVLAEAGLAKQAVAELAALAVDGDEPNLVEVALDVIITPYAQAGRADLAAALFDRGDRAETASRLRRLASAYADQGKLAAATTVLRAAMARDADPTALCLDRADLVDLASRGKNKVELALAVAELAEARKAADATCTPAAQTALARAEGAAR